MTLMDLCVETYLFYMLMFLEICEQRESNDIRGSDNRNTVSLQTIQS